MTYEEWAILRHLVFIRCPICGKVTTTDNPTIFLGCENCLIKTNYVILQVYFQQPQQRL